jgi:hypothetical protein
MTVFTAWSVINNTKTAEASTSGTNMPISKGGTGASDANQALKNLLPSLAGNDGKVLGLDSGNPAWVSGGVVASHARYVQATGTYTATIAAATHLTVPMNYKAGDSSMLSGNTFVAPVDGIYIMSVPQFSFVNPTNMSFINTQIIHTTAGGAQINSYVSGGLESFNNKSAAWSMVLKMNAGEKAYWNIWAMTQQTLTAPWAGDDAPVTFALVEQSVPYNFTNDSTVTDYSYDEQPTGERWVNGKPIYKKSILVNMPSTAWQTMDVDFSGITGLTAVVDWSVYTHEGTLPMANAAGDVMMDARLIYTSKKITISKNQNTAVFSGGAAAITTLWYVK